jgi:hypothetical protein
MQTNDGGIWSDFAINDQVVMQAQAAKANLQPYSIPVPAENILEVRHGDVGGLRKLVRVRVLVHENEVAYLEIRDGIYVVTKFTRDNLGTWSLKSVSYPKINNKNLTEIPFRWLADDDDAALYDDLCAENETHYAKNGKLEVTLAWSGKPQPWVSGVADDVQLSVAQGTLWRFANENAKCGYLAFDAANIATVKAQITACEEHMVVLGSRMLASEKTNAASESETSVNRRAAAEGSILAGVARHISEIMTDEAKWRARWQGADESKCSFELNTDFVSVLIDANLLAQLTALNQAGKLPDPLFFECLRQGEIVPEAMSFTEYQDMQKKYPADPAPAAVVPPVAAPLDPNAPPAV